VKQHREQYDVFVQKQFPVFELKHLVLHGIATNMAQSLFGPLIITFSK
jgi:hypothetical protein